MIEGHVDINESHQSVIDLVLNLAMMGGHLQRVLKRIPFSHQKNIGLLKVPKKVPTVASDYTHRGDKSSNHPGMFDHLTTP